MSQIVTGPDGVEHEFPDETPDDVIKNVMAKTYRGSDLSSGAKEFGRSVGEGATGLLDIPSRLMHRGAKPPWPALQHGG